MANASSYAQIVSQRGSTAYHMLHEYDNEDCINLYHGDAAFPPHSKVVEVLRSVTNRIELWNGKNEKSENAVELKRYRVPTQMTIQALKDAIVNDFVKNMPANFNRNDVFLQTGAGVTHIAAALFNHFRKTHSTVMMFAPTYTSFLFVADTFSCDVLLMPPRSDGQITPDLIENSLLQNPHIKTIFLVNPNNPSGQLFTKEELESISRLAIKHNLLVICDEIFHKLVHDADTPFISLASIEIDGERMFDRTITLRSVSKDHGLASIRTGYAIGSKNNINDLFIHSFTFASIFNVDDLAQHVSAAALTYTPDSYYEAQRDLLRYHRDLVIDLVNEINEKIGVILLRPEKPLSGIFHLIDFSALKGFQYQDKTIRSDFDLCALLLKSSDHSVALLPASCGGYEPDSMKLRLTLSSSEEDIRLGLSRLGSFVEKLWIFHQPQIKL